jgi:hypothetical protein
LYAIPAAQFSQMTELLAKSLGGMAADAMSESEELADQYYRALDADQLMLAHRDSGWEPSDPRKIEDWFQRAIDTHGEVLRRLCRYHKAWRDYTWDGSKLSSLAVMVCVVDILDALTVDMPTSRDDVAMLLVTERLANRLSQPIPNPVMTHDSEVALDRDWTAQERATFVAKAKDFHQRLADAMNGTDNPAVVLTRLRAALGNRITNDVSVIRSEQREAIVKSFPKVAVAAPVVRKSTSG